MGTCGCTRNGKGYQTCEWGWGVVDYDEQGMFVRRPVTQEEIAACIYLEENGLVRGDLWGRDGKVGYRQERGVPGDYIVTFSADGRHMHAWLAVRKETSGAGPTTAPSCWRRARSASGPGRTGSPAPSASGSVMRTSRGFSS